MSPEVIATINKTEELLKSELQKFEGLQLVDHMPEDLENRTEVIKRTQELLYVRLEQKGISKEAVLNLTKEDYPSIFRFFRLRYFQNLIPTKIEE